MIDLRTPPSEGSRLPTFTDPKGEAEVRSAYDAVLRKWTAPYAERFVPTRLGDVHVVISGDEDAPPVVLLHAYFATAAVWAPNAGALSRAHRVVAVDVLGDANPSRPTRPVAKLDDVEQWFTDLLDGLGIGRADLVGNSLGGFLAAAYTARAPERVRSLTLIAPAATFAPIRPFYLHMFLPKMVSVLAPRLPGRDRRVRRSVRWAFAGLPADRDWARLFQRVLKYGTGANRVFPRLLTAEELATLVRVPTLLLVGDHERIYGRADVLAAARRALPGIRAELVPDAHHIAALANPEAVDERILAFLAERR